MLVYLFHFWKPTGTPFFHHFLNLCFYFLLEYILNISFSGMVSEWWPFRVSWDLFCLVFPSSCMVIWLHLGFICMWFSLRNGTVSPCCLTLNVTKQVVHELLFSLVINLSIWFLYCWEKALIWFFLFSEDFEISTYLFTEYIGFFFCFYYLTIIEVNILFVIKEFSSSMYLINSLPIYPFLLLETLFTWTLGIPDLSSVLISIYAKYILHILAIPILAVKLIHCTTVPIT